MLGFKSKKIAIGLNFILLLNIPCTFDRYENKKPISSSLSTFLHFCRRGYVAALLTGQ
jgi:hypothetical protein